MCAFSLAERLTVASRESVSTLDESDISCIVLPMRRFRFSVQDCHWMRGSQATVVSFISPSLDDSAIPMRSGSARAIFDGSQENGLKWTLVDCQSTECTWSDLLPSGSDTIRALAPPSLSCRLLVAVTPSPRNSAREPRLLSLSKSGGVIFHRLPEGISIYRHDLSDETSLQEYMEPCGGMLVNITRGPVGDESIQLYAVE